MKKLASIVLLCVLMGSFMIGVLATDAQARFPDSPVKNCTLSLKLEPVCNMNTGRLYYWFNCPFGFTLYWTGEYCL